MQLRCVRSYYNKCLLLLLRGEKFITKHSHFCSNGEKAAFVLNQTFLVLKDGPQNPKMGLFGHLQKFDSYVSMCCLQHVRCSFRFFALVFGNTKR